jgi:hypothetical protein
VTATTREGDDFPVVVVVLVRERKRREPPPLFRESGGRVEKETRGGGADHLSSSSSSSSSVRVYGNGEKNVTKERKSFAKRREDLKRIPTSTSGERNGVRQKQEQGRERG